MKRRSILLLILLGTLYVGASVFVVEYFAHLYRQQELVEEQLYLRKQSALLRAKLETTLNQEIFAAESLVVIANINREFIAQHWQHIAAQLVARSQLIRNISLAPDNIVQYVYPLEGNQRAMGFDYRTDEEQFATVEQARLTQSVVLAGPLTLVQGGEALLVQFPLFANPADETSYWGTLSLVLDITTLYQLLELDAQEQVQYALKNTAKGSQVFYGNANTFAQADVILPLHLPNGRWALAAKFNAAPQPHATLIRALGALLCLVLFVSVAILVRAYYLVKATSLQDDLTMLANRRAIMQHLNDLTRGAEVHKHFAIINIDVNDFKAVNDSYGHDCGDALLVHIARELQRTLRDSDIIARLGGDEFLVLLHRISSDEQVAAIVDKLRLHIERSPLNYKGHIVYPSISCGFSCYTECTLDIAALLAQADKRMYEDKQSNKLGGKRTVTA
ncbi:MULTISPECIES: diguanylate cyclase [unclassified Pseudoalteromonas]|uniref:diguanylate cyclase n=1 Tax=unclassified Pseudoalteromonas TaxID=194690 RepID=UPI000CF74FFE|nr:MULTISPECIES: diguanylate cyclase [unclassified Pseudoalteromonas]MBS3797816.1 sensor domain-containing diguanylate cyclase [Pseudoalteromonas sp. BDTF-M6]